jgi:hypothetical protein
MFNPRRYRRRVGIVTSVLRAAASNAKSGATALAHGENAPKRATRLAKGIGTRRGTTGATIGAIGRGD